MADIYFDATQSKGVTKSTDGHEIHYQVFPLGGIGEERVFQVEYEAAGNLVPSANRMTFKPGLRKIKLEGHTFYLENVS